MTNVVQGDAPVLGGIPTAQPVTGGDWMDKLLNATVQVQTARYASKYAGALAQQHTGGAAVPQDGNPNAEVQQPSAWNVAAPGVGLTVSRDALLVGGIILAVVLAAVALD